MTPIQETFRNPLSRRALLGLVAGAAVLPVAVSGGTAQARRRVGPAPETVGLPAGFRPEGITSGPDTRFYAGSVGNGRIVTGDLLGGPVTTLLPAADGRSLRGLYWDGRTRLVWTVGNVGSTSHVWAVNDTTGAVVSETVIPGAGFLNDLVVTTNRVYVTDSRVDRLTVLGLGAGGAPIPTVPLFRPLSGAWPPYDGTNINANGIRQLPDGSLVLNNTSAGGLWQVDPVTGATRRIPVTGGPGIISGDGLEIDGNVIYNVRGSGPDRVAVVLLSRSGAGWTAKWAGARTDETLDVPSTATLAGGWLWVINARFGVTSPETAAYWVTRLPAR